ncbi:hypothetical protein AaE_004412 [Aphanomyces astaci]|uniref:GAF domain-containing protein n=1 Tax=Aphanomyces astaci TaxID=112090 RepID=A0A6A5AJ55_APHAT|nr:hypothetical protein AaE_004412 [Aphanomyces astaci]
MTCDTTSTSLPIASNEDERLQALYQLSILDTPKDHVFDIVCDLAAKALNCSCAAVTFIDKDRQWFKATLGLSVSEVSRGVSFCTVASSGPIAVPDTLLDDRFAHNPLVTQANVRFYAAAPITTPTGHVIGTVCGFDDRAHLDDDICDMAALVLLAAAVLDHLDKAAYNLDDPWQQAQRQSTYAPLPKWTTALPFFSSRKLSSIGSCDDVTEFDWANKDDQERMDVLSRLGLTEIPRTISLCDTVSANPTVVLDTLQDPRLVHNPFVNGTPRIRFYASAPLVSPQGFVVGSVFVLDVVERPDCDTANLVALSKKVMEHLDHQS